MHMSCAFFRIDLTVKICCVKTLFPKSFLALCFMKCKSNTQDSFSDMMAVDTLYIKHFILCHVPLDHINELQVHVHCMSIFFTRIPTAKNLKSLTNSLQENTQKKTRREPIQNQKALRYLKRSMRICE